MNVWARPWVRIVLSGIVFAFLFAAFGLVARQSGKWKPRPGQEAAEKYFIPTLAACGALIGVARAWRARQRWSQHPGTQAHPVHKTAWRRFVQEWKEARNGRPEPNKAAHVIATMAVMPAAILGLFVGWQLLEPADPLSRVWLWCAGGAFGAGFGALLLVIVVYKLFGFRPVAFVGDVLLGGIYGFAAGALLGKATDSWWPYLLGPFGAVLVPLIMPRPQLQLATEASTMQRESAADQIG